MEPREHESSSQAYRRSNGQSADSQRGKPQAAKLAPTPGGALTWVRAAVWRDKLSGGQERVCALISQVQDMGPRQDKPCFLYKHITREKKTERKGGGSYRLKEIEEKFSTRNSQQSESK